MASGIASGGYRYQMTWTPLQRVYLSAYLRSALRADLGPALAGMSCWRWSTERIRVDASPWTKK